MKDWKEYLEYFKDFFNTLAGKLTAILAFALLVILALGWFGASIPTEYRALVYVVVIGAMLIFLSQAVLAVNVRRKERTPEEHSTEAVAGKSKADELPVPPPSDTLSQGQAKQAYLAAVIADSRPLRLVGLDEHAGDPNSTRLSLEDIYVALNTTTMVEENPKKAKKRTKKKSEEDEILALPGREKSRPLSALEALVKAAGARIVLLGFPGTGKSTFVRYLALRMAQELAGEPRRLDGWQGPSVLPVAISLGRFAETVPSSAKQGTVSMLEEFLVSTLKADVREAGFAPLILDVIREDGGLVLFDGLDEVADLNLRPIVTQAVQAFVEKYGRNPNSRFLVTCRTYSYQDPRWQLTKWPVYELALLNQEQIEQFVHAWYDQHTLLDQSRAQEYKEKRGKLLAALRPGDRRRLYEVAPFPIILTIMAIVHASYELPDSRAQVYMQCVELLLEKWQTKRSIMGRTQTRSLLADLGIPATRLYQALYEIAYEAHRGRAENNGKKDGGSLVTEKLVAGVMQEHLQDADKLKTFLDYCQSANGLLMLQGTVTPSGTASDALARRVYTFPHLTFEEYLAGRHLESLGADQIRVLLDEAHDRWREVVKLLAEYLCFERADRDRMNGLLEALSTPFPQKPTEKSWRALWLAGELLVLYRRAISKPTPFETDILKHLRSLVETCALTVRERADAADVLDQFWQPDDIHHFVSVPDSKLPEYLIAKYPVTNAQYEQFLMSPDFGKQEYWVDFSRYDETCHLMDGTLETEGWEWYKKNKNEESNILPRYWHNAEFGRQRSGAPVVGVSWYEANAYCKWLLGHWDENKTGIAKPRVVRLPTETEWIAAAGGEVEGRYAWDGNQPTEEMDEIIQRANVYESKINRTTPVWMYPLGISPHGVMDMSGNVWEWQANYRDQKNGWLALRGGSWLSGSWYARLSERGDLNPDLRDYSVGFRVVALPR